MGRPKGSRVINGKLVMPESQAGEDEPSSTETYSLHQENEGPMPIPESKPRRARVKKAETWTWQTKQLPSDNKEFDEAIAPSKVMVRPILHAISRVSEACHASPLDSDEIESGTVAFAALMYQYGAMLDARVLVALWVASVSIPRIPEVMEYYKQKKAVSVSQIEAARDEMKAAAA